MIRRFEVWELSAFIFVFACQHNGGRLHGVSAASDRKLPE
jgi:hypothetical protein